MIELKGKKVIVTGGAMGIGLATCRRLVKEGCDVTIWDLSQKDLDAVAKELKEEGGNVFPYQCDVSDKDRVRELAVQAEKIWGRSISSSIMPATSGTACSGNSRWKMPSNRWMST